MMTITIAPQTEARLRETAQREGQDVNALADVLLAEILDDRAREFAESVSAIQEGFDAVAEGRTRSLEDYIAEQRAKRGLPDAWPPPAAFLKTE